MLIQSPQTRIHGIWCRNSPRSITSWVDNWLAFIQPQWQLARNTLFTGSLWCTPASPPVHCLLASPYLGVSFWRDPKHQWSISADKPVLGNSGETCASKGLTAQRGWTFVKFKLFTLEKQWWHGWESEAETWSAWLVKEAIPALSQGWIHSDFPNLWWPEAGGKGERHLCWVIFQSLCKC